MSRWRGLAGLAAAGVVLAAAAPALPAHATTTTTTQVTFAFAGDTILGNTPQVPANPARWLAPVAGNLSSGVDVTFGNLEGTLTNGGPGKCGGTSGGYCYQFRNPPSFARAYAGAGFDVLNLANNHSHDFGTTGLTSTETAIRNAGMHYTGTPGHIAYLTRHGVHIAFVGFAPYASSADLLDLSDAAGLIRHAHRYASIVVVYMHAGAEGSAADHVTGREEHYAGEDRGNPRRFAHMAIDNGAAIVVASGPHVMRGMELYKKHLIAYSLGDFANYRNFSSSGVLARSGILHVALTSRGAFVAASLTSVHLAPDGRASLGGDSVGFVASLSRQDFGSTAARFSPAGRIAAP